MKRAVTIGYMDGNGLIRSRFWIRYVASKAHSEVDCAILVVSIYDVVLVFLF